jgi:hypothetical protein
MEPNDFDQHAGSQPPPPPEEGASEKQVRNWAMLCHLSALVALVGVPLGNVVGPLIVWLVKRNEIPAVDEHGKESLNFQISMTIYMFVAGLSIFLLVGFLLLPAVALVDLILVILASVRASDGGFYRYPLTIRFLK